jgi:predicted O-methyltransferase YrrM
MDGAMEAAMTFRIADMGNEAQLVEIGERLSDALSSAQYRTDLLDLSPDYVDAAKTVLTEVSGKVAALRSRTVALTEQQVATFLDFDPVFLDRAKDMLRAFIEKTEGMGVRGNANGD